jgi:hypothetical protein
MLDNLEEAQPSTVLVNDELLFSAEPLFRTESKVSSPLSFALLV